MDSAIIQAVADAKDAMVNKASRMKGMKIRDEFICPITYELMREPVVASDGHTYEKNAIEKWLKNSYTSPRNGESIEATLIPNYNLKKLIQDIINEGGAGFYTDDTSNKDRLFDVLPEKILVLECLGPPESDWNQQSFQVNRFGCVGGRKHNPEDNYQTKEVVLFKDITVSRRHFEITQNADNTNKKQFSIRDLGSAGGTFIRIAYGTKKQLHPGMIILLGKHQFTVSAIDDWGGESNPVSPAHSSRRRSSQNSSLRKSNFNSEMLMTLVENAERLIANIECESDASANVDLTNRLKNLSEQLTNHLTIDEADLLPLNSTEAKVHDSKEAFYHHENSSTVSALTTAGRSNNNEDAKADAKDSDVLKDTAASSNPSVPTGNGSGRAVPNYNNRRCTLTCCAPDGSPLQGKSFIVSPDGAVMGRKFTNSIALFMKVIDGDGEERIVNVDTAISSEHARVEFDDKSGRFFICDGTQSKCSTNGTWYRLSGPHQESPPHVMQSGTEVLIGTVRFQVRESMTISEHKMGLLRAHKNMKIGNFGAKKLVVGGTSATALFVICMPRVHCASGDDPFAKLVDQAKNAVGQAKTAVTGALGDLGVGAPAPPTDPVEKFISEYGPSLQSLGFGGFMGICTGVAFKRLGNQAAYSIGLGFIGIQALVYLGYIKVDYKKVTDDAKRVADLNGDGKFDSKDVSAAWTEIKKVLTYNLPSAGGFSAGLALGVYFGN